MYQYLFNALLFALKNATLQLTFMFSGSASYFNCVNKKMSEKVFLLLAMLTTQRLTVIVTTLY